jgi:hypothetical protein
MVVITFDSHSPSPSKVEFLSSLDNWQSSRELLHVDDKWKIDIETSKSFTFKFKVDDLWQVCNSYPAVVDSDGNVNNLFCYTVNEDHINATILENESVKEENTKEVVAEEFKTTKKKEKKCTIS